MCHKWDEYSIQLNTQYASAAGRYSDKQTDDDDDEWNDDCCSQRTRITE